MCFSTCHVSGMVHILKTYILVWYVVVIYNTLDLSNIRCKIDVPCLNISHLEHRNPKIHQIYHTHLKYITPKIDHILYSLRYIKPKPHQTKMHNMSHQNCTSPKIHQYTSALKFTKPKMH